MSYRVVQWATGAVGLESLRGILRHPQLELAGVLVTSAAKDAQDAGVLCGLDPIGVAATRIGAIGGSMAGGQLLEAGFSPAQFFAAIAIPVACCLLLAQWRSSTQQYPD